MVSDSAGLAIGISVNNLRGQSVAVCRCRQCVDDSVSMQRVRRCRECVDAESTSMQAASPPPEQLFFHTNIMQFPSALTLFKLHQYSLIDNDIFPTKKPSIDRQFLVLAHRQRRCLEAARMSLAGRRKETRMCRSLRRAITLSLSQKKHNHQRTSMSRHGAEQRAKL